MRERLTFLYRKLQNELKPSGFHSTEKITFYRLVTFFFSKKGFARIGNIFRKAIRFSVRLLFGDKAITPLYSKWRGNYLANKPSRESLLEEINNWESQPLISVIVPVYNPDLKFLSEAVNSVKNQVYSNWELCLSDDCSSDSEVLEYLKGLLGEENIKGCFREENGNISVTLNSATALATGEYYCFLDQDDVLSEDALFHVAKTIIQTNCDICYSDEDKISESGKNSDPFFKPQWSPHSLLSRNYINHLLVVKKELFARVDGFRLGFEGAQDHDFLLRASEQAQDIVHIPEILYHWRMHQKSTAANPKSKEWAYKSGELAIKEAFNRKGLQAKVETLKFAPGNYRSTIEVDSTPLISIIIPTKDKSDILRNCLESIYSKSTWKNFEILIVDNNSLEQETFALFYEYQSKSGFKVLNYKNVFNYSEIQNLGVKESNGDYIVLLNNDTEIITPNWMELMLGHAQMENSGAVGAKLFFPNNKLQHVGVILGIRGIVGHAFVGSDANNPGYFQSNNIVSNYSAVTAACLMVSKKKFLEVDGFDPNLAIEYNDVDFNLKLYKAGYFNVFLPDVQLIHYESLSRGHPSSTRESNRQSIQEGNYFSEKWKDLINDDPFYNIHLSRQYTEFQYNV